MMREIALFSNIYSMNVLPYFIILSTRIFLPYFVRLVEGKPVMGEFWIEYAMQVFLIILGLMMPMLNTSFILFGVLDFKRKFFYARLMRSMLMPTPEKHFVYGNMFPSVNLLDAKSICSWISLRNGLLDLGKKYTQRVFLFSSCFIAFYSILGIILALNFFAIVNFNFQPMVWVFSVFDIVIVSSILIT